MKTARLGGWSIWTAALVALLAVPCVSLAGPALNDVLESYAEYGGWSVPGEVAELTDGGGYLRISFDPQGVPLPQDALVRSESSAQNYSTATVISFDFLAEDLLPNDALVYLHSTSGRLWEYSFEDYLAGLGWTTDVHIGMDYSYGWHGGSENAQDFESDLASVDWVGVIIGRAINISPQDYGLDNFVVSSELQPPPPVPEPGTVAMLSTALLSFGALLRWRPSAAASTATPTDPAAGA